MFVHDVTLPRAEGQPFSLENLLKLNAEGNWQQQFRHMLCDALHPQLQAAMDYFGKLLMGCEPPEGATYDEEHDAWVIHLDSLSPQLAAELLWAQAHRVPLKIIPRPESVALRSRLADQLWDAAGVESHIIDTALHHYRYLPGVADDNERYQLMTMLRLGVEIRSPGETGEPASLDSLADEAMMVPGTDYFYVSEGQVFDDGYEADWLRAVLVGLLLK